MPQLGGNAIVLGASMGGMLAARVLADFYRTVTVVERDVLPDDPANRKAVPQGRQPHILLARSSQVLDELFPGFLDELVDGGAPVWNDGDPSRRETPWSDRTNASDLLLIDRRPMALRVGS
jgi:2-polyprenyl-6-methoxyphenol hydroxylase-like FAD-dependent oxidoreductase